jgi:hypothetical protein
MDMVGFVPEPHSGRGTMGIIWSCLTTIFLSTWTSYHMDFGDEDKIYDVVFCVVFPEVMATKALNESFDAWYFRKAMRLMPGWEHFSLKQAFLIRKNGVTIQSQDLIKPDAFFDRARSGDILFHQLPQNSQIDARSKSDWLSKTMAICQALWFVSNTASRLVAGYEISLLEGLTTAYVFCGLVMFISWYQCPQDVTEKFDLQIHGNQTTNAGGEKRVEGLERLSDTTNLLTATVFLAIFTGIHLAAWNYPFASGAEAWIWRVLSIATFILGLVTFVLWRFEDNINSEIEFGFVTTVVYVFVRLGVTALAFIAFRHAPAGIYLTTSWPAYWVHISG